MELKKVIGCICDSLTADNVEETSMSPEQKLEVLNKIKDYLTIDHLNYLMQWFIGTYYTDYHCTDKPCETCGDYIETFIIDI